jgi:hypothetical protein
VIRAAVPDDAARLLELKLALDDETSLMMLEPGERRETTRDLAGHITASLRRRNCTLLVADPRGALVGYVEAGGGEFARNRPLRLCRARRAAGLVRPGDRWRSAPGACGVVSPGRSAPARAHCASRQRARDRAVSPLRVRGRGPAQGLVVRRWCIRGRAGDGAAAGSELALAPAGASTATGPDRPSSLGWQSVAILSRSLPRDRTGAPSAHPSPRRHHHHSSPGPPRCKTSESPANALRSWGDKHVGNAYLRVACGESGPSGVLHRIRRRAGDGQALVRWRRAGDV